MGNLGFKLGLQTGFWVMRWEGFSGDRRRVARSGDCFYGDLSRVIFWGMDLWRDKQSYIERDRFMERWADLYWEGCDLWRDKQSCIESDGIYREISRVVLRGMGFIERYAELYLEGWDLWRDKQSYIERDGIYGQISRVVLTGMGFIERYTELYLEGWDL